MDRVTLKFKSCQIPERFFHFVIFSLIYAKLTLGPRTFLLICDNLANDSNLRILYCWIEKLNLKNSIFIILLRGFLIKIPI